MNFKFKYMLCVLFLLVLSSCGKKGLTSKTSIQIFDSSVVTGISQLGGVMIYGHRLDDFQSFAVGVPGGNGNVELDLEQGIWEFYAIGWDGIGNSYTNKNLTGDNRCGYVGNVDLNTPDKVLNININKSNCTLPLPGGEVIHDSSFFETGDTTRFRQISLKSCITLPGAPIVTSCDQGSNDEGLTLSYRVVLKGGMELNHNSIGSLPNLTSECIDALLQDEQAETSHIRIPVGSANDSIVNPLILAYSEANCTGDPIYYDFRDGLLQGINIENKATDLRASLYTDRSLVFFEHNPETINTFTGYNPFGNGSDGDATTFVATDFQSTRVTTITAASTLTVSSATGYFVGDEVMLYVNDQYGTGCGAGSFAPGLFQFHHIKSITGNDIELFNSATEIQTSSGKITINDPIALNLLAAPTLNTGNWCSVQITRVPNFHKIEPTTASINYSTTSYNITSGSGGITVMRAQEAIRTINPGYDITVDATGSGLPLLNTVDYSICTSNTWPCFTMGAPGVNTMSGSGSIIVFSSQIDLSTNNFSLISQGNGDATTGASGGQINVQAHTLNINAGKSFIIDTDGQSGTVGGNGGNSYIDYCNSASSILGTFSQTSVGGAPGGNPGITNTNTGFCN